LFTKSQSKIQMQRPVITEEIQSVRPIFPTRKPTQFINPETGKRAIDGRTVDEFRKMFMKCGVTQKARGSAYIELNNTKVICSVYGPRQAIGQSEFSEIGTLHCELTFAQFAHQKQMNRPKKNNLSQTRQQVHEYSAYMREALMTSICLEKFPKSTIDVYAFVLEDDGSVLSAAITCASLALADAGIEMYGLVSACSAAQLENHIVVDPVSMEHKFATGGVVCAYMPSQNELTQLTQVGDMQYQKVVESVDLCVDGCNKIHQLMTNCLIERATLKQKEHDTEL
jgi:exosome complex component MTR3